MRLHNILLLSLLSLFVIAACNMFNEPAHNNPNRNVTLNVEDASCTEAWIEVKFTDVEFPAELRYYVNDSLAESITAVKDTLLYIEGLQPSRTYRVKAEAVRPQETLVKSTEAEVTTMDTTSHNFTWQTFTFGGSGGSSHLRDVAIINENDIWAVGEINIADTTNPNGYTTYNAVHWNGQEWELKRALFHYQGQLMFSDIRSILAFSANDIWFEAGIHWNGENFETKPLNIQFQSHVNAMWGTSSSDFYIVGDNGNIAHYNGESWEKIESGTEVRLLDVYGKDDGSVVYAVGYEGDFSRSVFLTINGKNNMVDYIYETTDATIDGRYVGLFNGVYCYGEKTYLLTSGRLLELSGINPINVKIKYQWNWFSESISGENYNDIIMSGQNGTLHHFNGITYKDYPELEANYMFLYGSDIKNSLTVLVGYHYEGPTADSPAIVIVGKR